MKISCIVKRLIDVTFSIALIILLSPLLLAAACLILLFEGRPIFYRSNRFVSVDKSIPVWKYRTMIKDATSPKYRLNERFMRDGYLDIPLDCEVYSPIGRILEKIQLVEAPQLWNIIFHDMSLIGNRPLPLENIKMLKKFQGWEQRFDSPAGLTGIAQVVGKFNLQPGDRLELEKLYSEVYQKGNILKCDFMIIFFTFKLMVLRSPTPLTKAREFLKNCLKQ